MALEPEGPEATPLITEISSTLILLIQDEMGVMRSTTVSIKQIYQDFYSTLYTSTNPNKNPVAHFLNRYSMPKLSTEHRDMLEHPFTSEELTAVAKNMKNNTTLGPDEFQWNFIESIWIFIIYPLGIAIRYAMNIKRVKIWQQTYKINLINVDMFLFVIDMESSLKVLQ